MDTPVPHSEALNVLSSIRSSTLKHASNLPHKDERSEQWQGLGFSIGGVRLVAEIGDVSELLARPRVTALPGVKPWVLGVANIRGRLLPVIDMHSFLQLPATVAAHQARVLVVEQEDVVAGLLIEQSLGLQHFALEAYEQDTGAELEGLGRFVRGAFRASGRVYHHVELRSILKDEAFMDVAMETADEKTRPNFWHLSLNELDLK